MTNIRRLVCKLLNHQWAITKDSGIGDATAGGAAGDSYLCGNEESLGNYSDADGNPILMRLGVHEARPVSDRKVTFTCSRCGLSREKGRWCEKGDEHELSDESMLKLMLEWEAEGYYDDMLSFKKEW